MIAIITYDTPHRKTQDVISRLAMMGQSMFLFIIPFEQREVFKPIYQHRPYSSLPLKPEDIARSMYIPFLKVTIEHLNDELIKNEWEGILIAGAGILPISGAINSHPGYLPNVRGLDALKWAIYEGQPIGVTTHLVTTQVDAGQVIERRTVPVYFEDTFHSVAQRVYETEIEMLCQAPGKPAQEYLGADRESHRRMPHHLELIMMEKFEQIRKNSKSWRSQ